MTNYRANTQSRKDFKILSHKLYIAFFKPYGVLSQFSPEPNSEKRTLAEFGFPKEVYPIGRLDYDSEGLLLLSDDGRLNSTLLDPSCGHPRTYLAQVENIPEPKALEALRNGVIIEGKKTLPAKAKLILPEPILPERGQAIRFRKNVPTSWLELSLTEGRNRQIRKMTAAVGHPTLRLMRISIGNLQLLDLSLAPGQWKLLSSEELSTALI